MEDKRKKTKNSERESIQKERSSKKDNPEGKNLRKESSQSEKRRMDERKRKNRREIVAAEILILVCLCVSLTAAKLRGKPIFESEAQKQQEEQKKKEQEEEKEKALKEAQKPVSITISAAGDCTLGTDAYFDYASGFTGKYDEVQDPGYFFEKVLPIFSEDDLTIVNMEGTLTEEQVRADKRYAFKADPKYSKILTEGSVEAANLANNHSKDYGDKSYTDTIDALDEEGVVSFGYDRTAVMDVKGIKVGLLGTYELAEQMGCEAQMIENIESLKDQGAQIIIASFHWGIERDNIPNEVQVDLAHSAIDHGADLVLGHHPHVLQGIEVYKGKNIVYSLANFCFGGNSSPSDMDTMIFQQTFTVKEGKLQEDNVTNIIPCKVSSAYAQGYNNYQPIPAEGDVKEKILARIEEYSQAVAQEE